VGHSPLRGVVLSAVLGRGYQRGQALVGRGRQRGQALVGRGRQRGQALVLSLVASLLVVLALFTLFNMGEQSIEKIRLQNTADAAAYSASVAEARDYNFTAYTNRAMVVNQVAVAQFVGLTSWFRNLSAFGNGDTSNWGRDYYDVFFDVASSPLSRIYKKFLDGMGSVFGIFDDGKGGSTFMGVGIKVFDTLIHAYGMMQKFYHYGTALTVAETLGKGFDDFGNQLKALTGVDWFTSLNIPIDGDSDIIKANDKDAKLSTVVGWGGMIYHFIEWFKFTETKDPNTYGKDGQEAARFAEVTMNSLDTFSRDRSTKPAWGVDMFYAPPLTFIDPFMLIPDPGMWGPLFLPVIHHGGTELKVVDASTGGAGAGGGAGGGGGSAASAVDCHGNPVSTSAYMFDSYSALVAGTDPAVLCQWDQGIVAPVGPPSAAQRPPAPGDAVYVWTGTNWVDQSTISHTISKPPANPPADPALPPGQSTSAAANSRSKTVWSAMDASSFTGLSLLWVLVVVVPIPIPVPFAPPWFPLSHGGAQAGAKPGTTAGLSPPDIFAANNNFATADDDAYGKAISSWMTTLSAGLRQSKGAGNTLDSGAGLTTYRDVADLSADGSRVGPPLLVEVEKPVKFMPSTSGTGRLGLEPGAPQTYDLSLASIFTAVTSMGGLSKDDKYMRALSKSEVYFSRPTTSGDTTAKQFARGGSKPNQVEYGSLYNPYWQARLAPNTFWEQMISMEMHVVGM